MIWSGTQTPAPSNNEVSEDRNAWTESPRGLWLFEDYPAGYIKKHKNLSLLIVYNAGHMVPYNQPGPALDMLIRFLKGESYYDRPLVSFASAPMPEVVPSSDVDTSALPAATGSSSSSTSSFGIGMIVLTAVVAFGVGIVVARATATRSTSRGTPSSEEVEILNKDKNYNAI